MGGHARGRLLQGIRNGKAHRRLSLNPSPFGPGGEASCLLTFNAMHNFWFALVSIRNSFGIASAILHCIRSSPETLPAILGPLDRSTAIFPESGPRFRKNVQFPPEP